MSKFTEFSFSLRDDDSDDSSADDSGEVSIAVDSDGRIARPAVAGAKRGAAAAGPQRVQGCDFGTRAYDALPSLRDNAKLLEQLRDDCQAVFTSESFWLPHHAKPTCALEQLALDIFQTHTARLGDLGAQSGVEWWVQVRQPQRAPRSASGKGKRASAAAAEPPAAVTPDIDFHWDKDEDLTDSGGPPLHPHLSTVTYLGDVGAPTLIIERAPGCPYAAVACGESDPETSDPRGAVACTYVSQPRTGKHLVFDGRWLHGAPAALAAEPLTTTRITFLANVWLHYTPMGLQRLPRVEVKRRNFGTQRIPFECRAVLPVIEHQVDEKAANHQFAFGPNGDDFALHLSMPNLSSAIVPQEASLPRDSGHHLLQFARGAAKVTAAGDDDDEANAPTQAAAKRRKK